MLLADASRYLDPSERQVFDSLAQKAMAAREEEQRQSVEAQSFRAWKQHAISTEPKRAVRQR